MLDQDVPLCGDIKIEFYHNYRLGKVGIQSSYLKHWALSMRTSFWHKHWTAGKSSGLLLGALQLLCVTLCS